MAVLPLEIAGLPYRRFSDQIKGLWTVPGICGIRFLVVDGIEFVLVALGIESSDSENLRNVSSSGAAFELDDAVLVERDPWQSGTIELARASVRREFSR